MRPRDRYCSYVLALFVALWSIGGTLAWAGTFYVAPEGNNSNSGTAAQPWATLQYAAAVVMPGDVVIVQLGTYAGAKFSRSGTPGAPITFHGEPGAVIATPGPLNANGDNLWIRNAHGLILEGFEVTGAPRAGIAIQGEPNAPATGNVVRNNFSHHNGRWGIFTGYAQAVLIEQNETSFSGSEHGIYVSNSADNPTIRWNTSHHNRASGIQINADPRLPGDGIITNALVEANIIYENGRGGGPGSTWPRFVTPSSRTTCCLRTMPVVSPDGMIRREGSGARRTTSFSTTPSSWPLMADSPCRSKMGVATTSSRTTSSFIRASEEASRSIDTASLDSSPTITSS